VVLLEQANPGRFVRHAIQTVSCDYAACAAGDVDGDGRPDLVTGCFSRGERGGAAVIVWRNLVSSSRD
jgi:hypothetical protein